MFFHHSQDRDNSRSQDQRPFASSGRFPPSVVAALIVTGGLIAAALLLGVALVAQALLSGSITGAVFIWLLKQAFGGDDHKRG